MKTVRELDQNFG